MEHSWITTQDVIWLIKSFFIFFFKHFSCTKPFALALLGYIIICMYVNIWIWLCTLIWGFHFSMLVLLLHFFNSASVIIINSIIKYETSGITKMDIAVPTTMDSSSAFFLNIFLRLIVTVFTRCCAVGHIMMSYPVWRILDLLIWGGCDQLWRWNQKTNKFHGEIIEGNRLHCNRIVHNKASSFIRLVRYQTFLVYLYFVRTQ